MEEDRVPEARLTVPLERLVLSPGLRGLFLGGSHGRGRADAFSGIDLVVVADPAEHAALIGTWTRELDAALTVVHRMERRGTVSLVNAIGDDWLRVDLLLVGGLTGRARDLLLPLHDPADLWSELPPTLPPASPDPKRVAATIREFLRIIGLLPVGAGRDEDVTLLIGLGQLRQLMIDLMLEECTEADRGGALHLSRLLPPDRMAMLSALPTPPCERNAIIAANLAYAGVFLPLAREMSLRLRLDWPEAFDVATRRRLRAALGVELPMAQ